MSNIIVFSGSGISASAGMSMFSTKGGLYARAKKRLKLPDGIKLFSYKYYKDNKPQAEAFYAGIYNEALQASTTAAHTAIHNLSQQGRLLRHYTLNIDGLAQQTGMDVWDPISNPSGSIVELHGNIRLLLWHCFARWFSSANCSCCTPGRFLVCPSCRTVNSMAADAIKHLQQQRSVPCSQCDEQHLRFKVMLYDDAEGEAITPSSVFQLLEEDLQAADAVVWAGISFEQSASAGYFQRVWGMLAAQGRSDAVKQVLINPDEDALFNLVSSCSSINVEENVISVTATADDALPQLVRSNAG